MAGVPGSHHPFFIDVLYRQRGGAAEQGVRAGKAMGLTRLPSKMWNVNASWTVAANIANDLAAYTRLLGFAGTALADAAIDTLRFRILHVPARLVRHARTRIGEDPCRLALGAGVHRGVAPPERPAGAHLSWSDIPRRHRQEPATPRADVEPRRPARAPRARRHPAEPAETDRC